MRLVDIFQKPDYLPIERGIAFPQFHEDGDKVQVYNPFDWNYKFWQVGILVAEIPFQNDFDPVWLMGGEL